MKNLHEFFIMSIYNRHYSYAKHLWAIKENCFQFQRRFIQNNQHHYNFLRMNKYSSFASSSLCSKVTCTRNYRTNCQQEQIKASLTSFTSSSPFCQRHTPQHVLLSSGVRSMYTAALDMDKDNSGPSQIINEKSIALSESLDCDNDFEDYDEASLQKQEIWDIAPSFRHSFNFGPYANESEVIKRLVDLDVKLYKWERLYKIPEFILKLDFDKDIAPYLRFLVHNGVSSDYLGSFLTQTPFILKEPLENLELRIKYLRSKRFTDDSIARIISVNTRWLLETTKKIDERLGFLQNFFGLTGNEVRILATTGPKVITWVTANSVRESAFALKERAGFEPDEIKQLILAQPKLLRNDIDSVWDTFDYIHNEVKISHEEIVRSPIILVTIVKRLKQRVGFLQNLGRAQFDPTKPNYIAISSICDINDTTFASKIAHASTYQFNDYLKTL